MADVRVPGPAAGTGAEKGHFARQATGLVREVSTLNAFYMNWISVFPPLVLAVSVFWTLSVFPGANLYLAILLAVLVAVPIMVAVGSLSSVIPRTGGDYVLVSRTLGPYFGMVSSAFTLATFFIATAFVALSTVTVAIGPVLAAIGLVTESQTLESWAATVATSKNWQFGLGVGAILLATIPHAFGWRVALRFLGWATLFSVAGFVLVAIVALVRSGGDFTSSFNDVSQPVTGSPDTYDDVITSAREAGFDTTPGFSMTNTWPALGAILGFLGPYAYVSIYVAGELRRGASLRNMRTMVLSVVSAGVIIALFMALFFYSFGGEFFRSINIVNGTEDYPFAAPPLYPFLAMIAANNALVAWVIGLAFAIAFPLLLFVQFIVPIRLLFAYAFDGVLPFKVANVSPRRGTPIVALMLAVPVSTALLAWAVWSTGFFTVLAFVVLFQTSALVFLCLAGAVLPYRRPELWRAATSSKTVWGIPLLTITGIGGMVSAGIVLFLYLKYEGLGITDRWLALRDMAIVAAGAIVVFLVARFVRARQGSDLMQVYREIPPE